MALGNLRLVVVLALTCGWLHAHSAAYAQNPTQTASSGTLSALSLATAERMMLEKNRDIALAKSALAQAGADVLLAGQRPNPQFSIQVQNINQNRGIGSGGLRDKTVDSILRLDQLIERGNKAGLRVESAKRLESAAAEDLADTQRQQRVLLATSYFDLLAAQDKVESARETARLFSRTADAAQLRLKAGDVSGADVARIRVDALRAENEARSTLAELARAQVGLAILLGVENDAARIRAASPWPTAAAASLAQDEARIAPTVDNRADVRAANARIAAAEKLRELARAQQVRDVSVGVQFEHYPVSNANTLGSGNSFGFSFSVPLFLRHNNEGVVARAEADWYAARDALAKVRALAEADLRVLAQNLAASRERLSRIETSLLPEARRGAESAEFAFRNGALGVMDLLDARRTLRAVEVEAANARADHARSLIAWRANIEPSADLEGNKK